MVEHAAVPQTRLVLLLTVLLGAAATAGCTPAAHRPAALPAGTPPSTVRSSGTVETTKPAGAAFVGTIEALPPAVAGEMTRASWRSGCPVPLADLRLLHLSYVDFEGSPHQGELVAHKDLAPALVRVFGKLYAARFPIRAMVRVDAYGGSDDNSMADDNTSMFNCRNVPNTTHWSNHAYGRAVDIDPLENPYLPGKQVMPPAGKAFLDRGNVRPGMIVEGDVVVTAFRAEGFTWGGGWKSGTDYQHFEKPG